MRAEAVFFAFDQFGSAGTSRGVELLADAFREMLADNRRETRPTRSAAYQAHTRAREVRFETAADLADWRKRGRAAARARLARGDFLLWASGNHLGVLPVLEELGRLPAPPLVLQLDAHLDVYALAGCTEELSHGNFLLHADGPLPPVVHVGHRDLFLTAADAAPSFAAVHPAADLHERPDAVLAALRARIDAAAAVWVDLDCDALDPAYFPAVTHPQPFGLSPAWLLRLLALVPPAKLAGVSVSEFDPAADRRDQSLALLVWLCEYVLLRKFEAGERGV